MENVAEKVAVVTGSNRGIGLGIVRQLLKRGVGVVYVTSRDTQRGERAVQELREEGLRPALHQLDTTDKESVKRFAAHLRAAHGGIDILVNNAAVISAECRTVSYDDAARVIDVNYRSYFHVMDHLFPLLKDGARVVNISSDCGHIGNIRNDHWVRTLTSDDLQIRDIDDFVAWFLDGLRNGNLKEEDFFTFALLSYRISKVAVSALTRVQQRQVGRDISVNSVHPGFVKTDMTAHLGELTVEQACAAPLHLALDCDQAVKGRYFWFDKSEVDWTDRHFDFFTDPREMERRAAEIYEKK